MKKNITILIADRNSHVREFLRRELIAEGFQVRMAEKGREVLRLFFAREPLSLVIIDPDLPDMDEAFLLKRMGDRIPALPVIIHSHLEEPGQGKFLKMVRFVEKGGGSIENLKRMVMELLENGKGFSPSRAAASAEDNREEKTL